MLNATQEAVLMTVDGMTVDRELPTPGVIGLKAQPPLTTAEVMVTAGGLIADGYLECGDTGELTFYTLTERGSDYAQSVIARGT